MGRLHLHPAGEIHAEITAQIRRAVRHATVRIRDLTPPSSQRNKALQTLSINTLPVYASITRYFVCVCPTTTHADSGEVRFEINAEAHPPNHRLPADGVRVCESQEVGPETYQRRGWCRLEQLAHITVGGLTNMFVFDGKLRQISSRDQWIDQSLRVIEGDFTDETDRAKMIDPILGLWALALSVHMQVITRLHQDAVSPSWTRHQPMLTRARGVVRSTRRRSARTSPALARRATAPSTRRATRPCHARAVRGYSRWARRSGH